MADLNFNQYQIETNKTAIYNSSAPLEYLIPALAAEAGEVCGKYAKLQRDKFGMIINDSDAEAIMDELGDVLWVVSELATALRTSLGSIAEHNIKKLQDRKVRGVLGGSGDKR